MKTIVIIQARMSSVRLPGKVLKTINHKPLLWYVVTRAKQMQNISDVIVATSIDSSDNPIELFCKKYSITCFRGDLNNVLSRYYHTAKKHGANNIIRITGDCPLIDGYLINQGIQQFSKGKFDYVSNTVKRTYPRGFDFEIMTFEALEKAYLHATKDFENEHVTPYIWKSHPEQFLIRQITQPTDYSKFRITVDEKEDFKVVKNLIEQYNADKLDYNQITDILIKHPEVSNINKNIKQKKI